MADPTPRHLPPTIRSKASTWPAAVYFFMWALLGLLIWLLLWLALVAGQFGQAHPDNSWVKEAYALKFAAAEQYLGQKKLLVVGGSASMFGVRSPDLEAPLICRLSIWVSMQVWGPTRCLLGLINGSSPAIWW